MTTRSGAHRRRGGRRQGARTVPLPSRHLHRRGDVRPGDAAHLRRQLGVSGARKPDPGQQRLLQYLDRPQADHDHPRQGRRAPRHDQRLRSPRSDAVPAQARQQGQLHLPVPRLDLQQHGQIAEGEGRQDRRLSGLVQHPGLARPGEGAEVRELSGLPVRQPECRRRRRSKSISAAPRP